MKKNVLILLIVAITAFSCKRGVSTTKISKEKLEQAQSRDASIKGAPEVTFDKTVFDYGTVNEGAIIETTFKVKNTGESDLIIMNAKASCGCTAPTWPKDPIKPGEEGEIKVKFDTNGQTNKQSKTVTLITNTIKGSEAVKVSGMVIPKNKN